VLVRGSLPPDLCALANAVRPGPGGAAQLRAIWAKRRNPASAPVPRPTPPPPVGPPGIRIGVKSDEARGAWKARSLQDVFGRVWNIVGVPRLPAHILSARPPARR
jgi:hypothetical protein